jgi:amino acid adenylation domain-containing protein
MPLFQVAFLMQNTVLSDLHLPGITCTFLPVHSGTARFDLTLSIMEAADGLSGSLEYRIDLFEASTIERFLQHYRNVLTACVRHPSRRLASIPLLTASERQQLLVAWNDTHQALLPETSLPALFAAQVERTPEAIAVVCEEALLTYRALNASANRLAHYLRRQGVGPEVLVGICLERSLDLVVGLLGILKAGAAYVPLDPAHPPARRQFILADSRAAVLLTHRSLGMDLAALPVRTIYLDTDRAVIARESAENLNDVRGAAQLAYVLYTSGSTGQPKGVQISHGALGNFFHSLRQQPGMTAVDVLLAVTTVAFDIATLELFLPLLVGARVVLVSRAVAADGQRLLRALATTAATVMQATPATWRLLLEAGWVGKPSLQVWCGGEALPRELALQLLASAPAVWNLYGPTETTIWSAVGPVQPGDGPVPLGRPIANTQLYVLDRFLQPVPIGVAGELYIGGAGVARGYGNRPALTAERFIGDPYSGAVGTRLYRTGDGVRRRPDGSLEFLGRLDQQVKLRGFRIEPGEVEAVLGQHAAVRQAVVLTREERPGAPRLVAYVMAHADRAPTLGELQHFLHERLPDYMVPAAFVFLDALPLTPNGKVDRQALPAPVRPDLQQAVVAPRTLLEEQLASIWAEVLQLECVGIHDNFFALGGHSLLATQVMARVSTALQAQFPLQTLFEAPTVAALALCLEAARPAGEPQPPLVRVPRSGPLPLSFAQQRLWFLDQLTPGHFLYNSAAAVRLRGGLNALALAQTFSEIVRRHEVLRATFGMLGEYPVQVIAAAAPVRLSVVDLRQVPAAQWQQAAQRLATEPFDLARGPLLRVSLLRLAEAEHMLVLVMHHIVSDGWSAGVMIREVVALYTAYTTGTPSPLPELPLQYADFAHWQRQWLQGEVLETQLAYWQQQLAGAPAALALPTDWPRPTLPSGRGTAQALALSPTLSAALRRLSERHGVTLFMTLLAAFNVMLRYHSGCDDLVVGTDVANRTRAEVEGLLGFFVNQLVLRADLRGNPTFRELLGRLRQVTLAAYAHQDIPFEMLVAALRPERRLQYAPLFQVKLVLQNAPMPAMQVAGLSLSPEILARSVVEFDLLLNLQDRPEGICGELEYRTDLFAATSIARFIEHFTTILRQVAAQPEVRLQTLEDALAAADQQHQSRHNKTLEEMHRQQLQHVRRQLRRRSAIPQNGD